MEKSEPSLAPEWLRNSGSGTGGASNHFTPSESDGILLALPKRSRSFRSIGKDDCVHPFVDQSSRNCGRRTSSSNGLAKHERNQYSRSYSSFNRGQRDREKGRLTTNDHWDAEYSDPLRSIITGRIEKDTLRRSQSLVSRKPSEVMEGRAYTDLRRTGQSNYENETSPLSVGRTENVSFERDFPSLGSEERPITPEIGRVPSPGVNRSMQCLSIGNSASIGGEGWTSALAEVPLGVGGNTNTSTSNLQVVSLPLATSSATFGLNMAETLVQAPSRSHTAQQPSVQDQKREELAILQSMKLIPMTLSIPKNMAHNSSDKLKPKTVARSGDQLSASKNGPSSMQLGTQLVRGANVKADAPKTSHTGKLLVLKPGREIAVSLPARDTSSSIGSVTNKVVNGQAPATPINTLVSYKSCGDTKVSAKPSAFAQKIGSIVDSKPTSAKAQSRSDFFKSMRKKSLGNSSAHADSSTIVSSVREKSDESDNGANASFNHSKDDDEGKCNGDACTVSQGLSETSDCDFVNGSASFPDEEEAAFLRSLGWEENATGDDEGLTEEEIKAFRDEYEKIRPTSKLCRGFQLKLFAEAETQAPRSGGPSLEYSKSESSP